VYHLVRSRNCLPRPSKGGWIPSCLSQFPHASLSNHRGLGMIARVYPLPRGRGSTACCPSSRDSFSGGRRLPRVGRALRARRVGTRRRRVRPDPGRDTARPYLLLDLR
jgi:hypothetical protein